MRNIRTSIFKAIALYVWDGLIASQGVVAIITLFIIVFVASPRILIPFFKKNKDLARQRALRTAVYLLATIVTFFTIFLNCKLAAQRADELIKVCNSYNEEYGKFPGKLEDLVPEFIPKIPLAKFALPTISLNTPQLPINMILCI